MRRWIWAIGFLTVSLCLFLLWRELQPPPGLESMGEEDLAPKVSLWGSLISGFAGLLSIVREVIGMFRKKQ